MRQSAEKWELCPLPNISCAVSSSEKYYSASLNQECFYRCSTSLPDVSQQLSSFNSVLCNSGTCVQPYCVSHNMAIASKVNLLDKSLPDSLKSKSSQSTEKSNNLCVNFHPDIFQPKADNVDCSFINVSRNAVLRTRLSNVICSDSAKLNTLNDVQSHDESIDSISYLHGVHKNSSQNYLQSDVSPAQTAVKNHYPCDFSSGSVSETCHSPQSCVKSAHVCDHGCSKSDIFQHSIESRDMSAMKFHADKKYPENTDGSLVEITDPVDSLKDIPQWDLHQPSIRKPSKGDIVVASNSAHVCWDECPTTVPMSHTDSQRMELPVCNSQNSWSAQVNSFHCQLSTAMAQSCVDDTSVASSVVSDRGIILEDIHCNAISNFGLLHDTSKQNAESIVDFSLNCQTSLNGEEFSPKDIRGVGSVCKDMQVDLRECEHYENQKSIVFPSRIHAHDSVVDSVRELHDAGEGRPLVNNDPMQDHHMSHCGSLGVEQDAWPERVARFHQQLVGVMNGISFGTTDCHLSLQPIFSPSLSLSSLDCKTSGSPRSNVEATESDTPVISQYSSCLQQVPSTSLPSKLCVSGMPVVATCQEENTFAGDTDAEPDAGVAGSDSTHSSELSTAKVRRQLKKLKSKEVTMRSSDPVRYGSSNYNQEVLAYIDTCCYSGMEFMAVSYLKCTMHKNMTLDSSLRCMRRITDVDIYNTLMRSLAKKGMWDTVLDLFEMIKKDRLTPNMQTFAVLWQCLGVQPTPDIPAAHFVLRRMEEQGLDIKKLFNTCLFYANEGKDILQGIKMAVPHYLPHPPDEAKPPSGILMKKFNASQAAQTAKREKIAEIKLEWTKMLSTAFARRKRAVTHQRKGDYGITLLPFLNLFEGEEYVKFLLQEIEELSMLSEHYSPNYSFLCRRLSTRVFVKYILEERMQGKVPEKLMMLYRQYLRNFMDVDFDLTTHRGCWETLISSCADGPSLSIPQKVWPQQIILPLGKLLLEIIISDVKINVNILKESSHERCMVPAFYNIYRHYSKKVHMELKPHPVLVKLYRGAEFDQLTFNTTFLPMLVPPVPWISTHHGSFLFTSVDLVRLPDKGLTQTQKMQSRLEVKGSDLLSVLDAINTLSACAWKINQPILDLLIELFNNNGDPALNVPAPPSECPQPPANMSLQSNQRQRNWMANKKAQMYSLWCTELYRLSIANEFRDRIFWFPHNMDFRGRVYPCPPHFNILGSDISRCMMKFAKGKALGPHGLDWLKIHLVNLAGSMKRCSNRQRLAYADEVLEDIVDSAEKPMTGRRWWQHSDNPWQTLACCMEVANAVHSGDAERYVCHLPVHQDGSCNGLQHYAALGRDRAGAMSVNLSPFDTPHDVYSDICALVEKERQVDEVNGNKIAASLKGFVLRKVIKQTVMTTVYGVTRYGANSQIYRQLKDLPEFPQDIAFRASVYLAEKTFKCLRDMFSATKEIQDWLTVSAQLISTLCLNPIEWETPIGLTVVQPYHKSMYITSQGTSFKTSTNEAETPNIMKQKNAFPPNFIHSLDSTHMMLTSLYCMKAGITFVSVHDCFWTHACDVDVMNRICREQFVALHSQPILKNLSRQLVEKNMPAINRDGTKRANTAHSLLHSVLTNVPRKGDFDLKKVLDSTYFFS